MEVSCFRDVADITLHLLQTTQCLFVHLHLYKLCLSLSFTKSFIFSFSFPSVFPCPVMELSPCGSFPSLFCLTGWLAGGCRLELSFPSSQLHHLNHHLHHLNHPLHHHQTLVIVIPAKMKSSVWGSFPSLFQLSIFHRIH